MNTISELRALNTDIISDGVNVYTTGYHSEDDGGGGIFKYDRASAAAEDGGSVIAPTSGEGRYLAIFDGPLNVRRFGATGDGSTDDTTMIQRAIDFVGARKGGTLWFPAGSYRITDTLSLPYSGVVLQGDGADTNHNVGSGQGAYAATRLVWGGASGGTMVEFYSPTGAGNTRLNRGGVRSFAFIGGSEAGIGIQIRSYAHGIFEHLYFDNLTDACLDVGVHNPLGDPPDTQGCRFANITARLSESHGRFIVLSGADTGNASLNFFEQCECLIGNGTGYDFYNCDNNLFIRCRLNRSLSGTGNAIECHGDDDGEGVCRDNVFIHFSTGGSIPILCHGTDIYTNPSTNNNFLLLDRGNNTTDPTLGTGATAHWSNTFGMFANMGSDQFAIGDTRQTTLNAIAALGSHALLVRSNTDSYIALEKPDESGKWVMAVVSATGDFRLAQAVGSGKAVIRAPVKMLSGADNHLLIGDPGETVTWTLASLAADGTLRLVPSGGNGEVRIVAKTRIIGSDGQDALFIENADGSFRWRVDVNASTGDLRVTRQAGSGSLVLPTALKFGSDAVTLGANDSAGAGFRLLRVPNS